MSKLDELIRQAARAVDRIEGVRLTLLGRQDAPGLAFRLEEVETALRTAWTDAEADLGRVDDVDPTETGAIVAAVLGADVEKLLAGEAVAFKVGAELTVEIRRADGDAYQNA